MRALLVLAALAFAPAIASAQVPPPDERAAAQALADAVERLEEVDRATEEDADDVSRDLESRRCLREVFRIPARRQDDLRALLLVQEFRHGADVLRDALARFRNEIAAANTQDPALISGRAAYRRLAKAYMALPAGGDVCDDLAAWRRTVYDRATIRRAQAEYRTVFAASGRGFQRKIAAAADRMRALGISEQDASRFEGDA
jgi:hypothetical protein